MNLLFSSAESALKELNLGTPASVPLDPESPGGDALTFRKHCGSWKLLVEEAGILSREAVLLSNATRGRRLKAALVLNSLLEKIVGEAELEVARVRACSAAVSEFVSSVR